MEVEKSNKKTRTSDQSNMVVAIGKRTGKSNEITVLSSHYQNWRKIFQLFPPISKFEEIK